MTTLKTAFLWDESFLWGLMAYKALKGLGLPFDLIRAEDVRSGILNDYQMLFVPGGWASNKLKALGGIGVKAIQNFVADGGNYLGFCGGAGLATLDGIGLLNIKRKPTKERVPSFSGRIHLQTSEHPIWGIKKEDEKIRSLEVEKKIACENLTTSQPLNLPTSVFNAWWPSQFIIQDDSIKVLANYGSALPEAFSSDLNVGDVEANGNWEEIEKVYQINLDPKRLLNEPAVLEGNYGKGIVMLSLVHFDTPEDENGQAVLRNLWEYLAPLQGTRDLGLGVSNCQSPPPNPQPLFSYNNSIADLESAVSEIIAFGERNFLWFRRSSMLLQWRRGVRGLEYCTLYIMIKEIAEALKSQSSGQDLLQIKQLLIPFTEKAKKLLMLERLAMQRGHITYERCDDSEIVALRLELFSDSKSHGGMFKDLIDRGDACLFSLLKDTARQKSSFACSG